MKVEITYGLERLAMYIQGKGVVNHPSDGYERHTANQLVLYAPHL